MLLLLVVVAILIACPYVMSACVCTEHVWPMNGAAWREQLPDQTIPHIPLTPPLLSFLACLLPFYFRPLAFRYSSSISIELSNFNRVAAKFKFEFETIKPSHRSARSIHFCYRLSSSLLASSSFQIGISFIAFNLCDLDQRLEIPPIRANKILNQKFLH